jgi:hypothetical protein
LLRRRDRTSKITPTSQTGNSPTLAHVWVPENAGGTVRIASSVVVLLITAVPCMAETVPHLRGTSSKEAHIIRDLLDRSSTARALANELETTDLIVYVELTPAERAGRAATRFVVATERYRFLRVVLGAMTHPRERAALLAHELQHAVEIGRARDVRDIAGLQRLYRQIGEDRKARFAFETSAARAITARVHRELATQPPAVSTDDLAPCSRVASPGTAPDDQQAGTGHVLTSTSNTYEVGSHVVGR